MAAISSPNLVRATMHMRGELGTNQKPLLVQTKSQGSSRKIVQVFLFKIRIGQKVLIGYIMVTCLTQG